MIHHSTNGLQNHLGADRPMHRMTDTSWTPKPDSGPLMGCNPSVPHSVPRLTQETYAVSLPASVLMLICGLWALACAHRSAHLVLGGVGGHGGVITCTPR
jgi:hypothetical protein